MPQPRISEQYLSMNRSMHLSKPHYGTSGHIYAEWVKKLCDKNESTDILDYGCGKRTLEKALNLKIQNYDPAIPGLDSEPKPADIVVCTDVMEHIEPECLDAVLDHLKSLTRKAVLLSVSVVPANKHLPDGRNAHLIVQGADYWLPKLMQRWSIQFFTMAGPDFIFIGNATTTH